MLTPEKDTMWRRLGAWLRRTRRPTKGTGCELCDKDPPSHNRVCRQSSASDLTGRPPSYRRQQDSKGASPPPYHYQLSGGELAATCTSAVISIVAVTRGSPSVNAQAVADIITYTANSVASAPTDKTKLTVAAIVAAISDHAANVAADPGSPSATIRRLSERNEIGAQASIPAFRQGFPEVLGKMNFVIRSFTSPERLPRDHVAVTIASAVAAVANAIANAPVGARMAIAAEHKTSAKHAAEVVSRVVRGTSWSEMALKNGESAGTGRQCALTASCGTCNAVTLAFGVLREYTTSVAHMQAAQVLDAVVLAARLCSPSHCQYLTCTCDNNPKECDAILQGNQLLTAMNTVSGVKATTVAESNPSRALAVAMTAEGGPSAQPFQHLNASEL